jgi:beta-hydroxylase
MFVLIVVIFIIVILFLHYCLSYYKNKCNEYFFTVDKYPKMKILENNWKIIKNEIPYFDINTITFERQQDEWLNDKADVLLIKLKNNDNWIKSWTDNNMWFNFPLMYQNQPIGKAEEICPKTIKLLKKLKNIQVAGYSLLVPYGEIDFHTDSTGPSFNSMAFNMKLTGGHCDLTVKSNNKMYTHIHQVGKPVIFNSELKHQAINHSDKNRIILYIDFMT